MQKYLENHQRKAGFQNHGENYAIEFIKFFESNFKLKFMQSIKKMVTYISDLELKMWNEILSGSSNYSILKWFWSFEKIWSFFMITDNIDSK